LVGVLASTVGKRMTTAPQPQPDEMREFMTIVYRALCMITAWIKKRYSL
jgi:hypothetical protein